MKIVAIETLCAQEFENVLWVRVHTDAGVIGLGETFYGAGAVASHIHETLATRLLGRDPLRIEAIHKELVNLPMAQSSTGAEYRAASAIDIALWDLWGKATNQSVHQSHPPPKDLRIEDVPDQKLGPRDVRVRIETGGICGSDLHYFNHGGTGTIRIREPMVLGHEVAGIIAEVGGEVTRIAIGTRVAVNPSRHCGQGNRVKMFVTKD
jgi:Alcohol dehydrogenase GroES-like domain/Mandelate racemase / muconate lactonizing enzyme, N-terminal domain